MASFWLNKGLIRMKLNLMPAKPHCDPHRTQVMILQSQRTLWNEFSKATQQLCSPPVKADSSQTTFTVHIVLPGNWCSNSHWDSYTCGSALLFQTGLLGKWSTGCSGLPPVWKPFTGDTQRESDKDTWRAMKKHVQLLVLT